jgi:serine protease Do
LVADVTDGGPADKAGIRRGDVIVAYDGKEIKDMQDLPFLVAATPVGKEVTVTVVRKGERKEFTVKIEKMKEEKEEETPAAEQGPELGMTLKDLTPQLAGQLGISETSGVIVVQVDRASSAAEAGIRPGDIIREVDQRPVENLEAFKRAVAGYKPGDTILFLVERHGQTLFLTLKVQENE